MRSSGGGGTLVRQDLEPERDGVAAGSFVQRQEARLGHHIANRQSGGDVDGVQGPQRLTGDGSPRPLGHFAVDRDHRPVLGPPSNTAFACAAPPPRSAHPAPKRDTGPGRTRSGSGRTSARAPPRRSAPGRLLHHRCRAAERERRWIRRRGSALAPLFIEQMPCGAGGQGRREGGIQVRTVGSARSDLSRTGSSLQLRIRGSRRGCRRLAQLRHGFSVIRDQDRLATANNAKVFAQAVLQLADADGDHGRESSLTCRHRQRGQDAVLAGRCR